MVCGEIDIVGEKGKELPLDFASSALSLTSWAKSSAFNLPQSASSSQHSQKPIVSLFHPSTLKSIKSGFRGSPADFCRRRGGGGVYDTLLPVPFFWHHPLQMPLRNDIPSVKV